MLSAIKTCAADSNARLAYWRSRDELRLRRRDSLNSGLTPFMTDSDVAHIAEGHTDGSPDGGDKFVGWEYHQIVTGAHEFEAFREYLIAILRNARISATWQWDEENQTASCRPQPRRS